LPTGTVGAEAKAMGRFLKAEPDVRR
jgi:hypothetical protein